MNKYISIKKRRIGVGHPAFIIAEVSSNHFQDFGKAVRLIKEAKKSGADAIKFQTYTPDTLTIDVNNKYFRIKHPKWGGQTFYQLYKKAYAPWAWFKDLKRIADDTGIIFFSTVFDKASVDLLEGLNVPLYKISSFELVDLQLIEYAARTKKPIIMSTGMATVSEIREAVNAARGAGAKDIALLKCVSSYPAKPEEMNLLTIPHMQELFRCPVGVSDHTNGTCVANASVSLGACIVEKHITLSRGLNTEDGFFSIEPQELNDMVKDIRLVEKALGKIKYGPTKDELKTRLHRRSLFAVKDIKKDEVFTAANLRAIRPGYGLAPKYLKKVLGKNAVRSIKAGTPLQRKFIG